MLSVRAAGPTIHHEALDWATRASANGGVISTTTIRAVSDFCAAIDRGGVRSSMYRLNLFCGGNLSGCLVPLYRGPKFGGTNFGNATDTNGNFVSADFVETGATGGLKGNGTNKYLNTGFSTNSLPSQTSVHLSSSGTGLETSGDKIFLGTFDNTQVGLAFLDIYSGYISARAFRHGTYAAPGAGLGPAQMPLVTSPGSSESHFIGSRLSTTSCSIYRGGTFAASNSASVSPVGTIYPLYVFTGNTLNGNPASGSTTSGTLRMYSIGTGLDATQAAAFSSAVIAFNTALGR
jgi:hypothetical protein